MRRVHDTRRRPGAPDIMRIRPTVKSRDDIPAILIGLQDLYSDEGTRKRLSGLPGRLVLPGRSRRVGRPGMEPLTILVLGVVKQGPGCDCDRLREPANRHIPIRRRPEAGPRIMGRGRIRIRGYRRLVDSVSLLTPELLAEVGRMVVERGHRVAGKKPGAASRGRRHSFVAGTDVHHPTDRSLPMDAARCMVRDTSRACGGLGPPGWRRKECLCGKLRVATSRLANPRPRDVEAPLRLALKLADRAEASRAEIDGMLGIPGPSDSIRGFIGHVRHRADLTGRRILKGETIPHRGKVHPISGPHTRWISKGKAGAPVEPGVPVRVPEDRHGFLPLHSVMWEGSDVDVAVPMGGEARARFPDLSVVSFDRGPHSPPDRLGPAGMPEPTRCPAEEAVEGGPRPGKRGGVPRGAARPRRRRVGHQQPGAPWPRPGAEPRKGGFRRRRGAGGAGRERPPPRPDAAGEGAPRVSRRRLTGASTGEPAHGRPRRCGARTGVPAGRWRPGCSSYVPATDRPVEAPGGAPTGPARVP